MARAKTSKGKKSASKSKSTAKKSATKKKSAAKKKKATAKKKTAAKKKAAAKKTAAKKKATPKRAGRTKTTAAKKTAKRKPAAKKKTAAKKTTAAKKKTAAAKKATKRKPAAKKHASTKKTRVRAAKQADLSLADAELFAPFTVGERADALRILTEDKRLASMAKVGRYRVVSVEPCPVKPPHERAGHRLASAVVYDYSQDRCVDAHIDLDRSEVAHLKFSKSQPMLARQEEATAISIALDDDQVKEKLSLGDEPRVAMHYWSTHETDALHGRRAAAVVFGQPGVSPSLVAVVDLVSNSVAEVVDADQW